MWSLDYLKQLLNFAVVKFSIRVDTSMFNENPIQAFIGEIPYNTLSSSEFFRFYDHITERDVLIYTKDIRNIEQVITTFDHSDITTVTYEQKTKNNDTFKQHAKEIREFLKSAPTYFENTAKEDIILNHQYAIPLHRTMALLKWNCPMDFFQPSPEFIDHVKVQWRCLLNNRYEEIKKTLEQDSIIYQKSSCDAGVKEIDRILKHAFSQLQEAYAKVIQCTTYDEIKIIWPAILLPKPKVL